MKEQLWHLVDWVCVFRCKESLGLSGLPGPPPRPPLHFAPAPKCVQHPRLVARRFPRTRQKLDGSGSPETQRNRAKQSCNSVLGAAGYLGGCSGDGCSCSLGSAKGSVARGSAQAAVNLAEEGPRGAQVPEAATLRCSCAPQDVPSASAAF